MGEGIQRKDQNLGKYALILKVLRFLVDQKSYSPKLGGGHNKLKTLLTPLADPLDYLGLLSWG